MNQLKLYKSNYPLNRITIFVGNYGSGKTEVAVNFALSLAAEKPEDLAIIDLDIANPYFRCREVSETMEKAGIRTIYPKGEYAWADLPIILPEIKGALSGKGGHLILDVGGDDVGARALGSLSEHIDAENCDVLFVLNAKRPFTDNVAGAKKMIDEVSASACLEINGLVVNSHLIHDTDIDVVHSGVKLAEEVSSATGIPIRFVSAMENVLEEINISDIKYPILKMTRNMLPPWEKTNGKLGPANFKL